MNHAGHILCAVAVVSLTLPGASIRQTPQADEIVVHGHFRSAFELSALEACGEDESWWVTTADGLIERYHAVASNSEPVFVVLRGRLSKPGSFGHLGAYNRHLQVTEVVDVRSAAEGDCAVGAAGAR